MVILSGIFSPFVGEPFRHGKLVTENVWKNFFLLMAIAGNANLNEFCVVYSVYRLEPSLIRAFRFIFILFIVVWVIFFQAFLDSNLYYIFY